MPTVPAVPAVFGIPPGTRRRDAYPFAVRAAKPIAYWRLGEAAGSSLGADDMQTYSGTYSGGTLGGAPIRPNTRETSYLAVASVTGLTTATMPTLTSWTIMYWGQSTTNTQYNFVFTANTTNGIMVRLGSGNNVVRYSEGSGWSQTSVGWSVGETAHWALTYGGSGSCSLYKNGVLVTTIGDRINRTISSSAWWIAGPDGSAGGRLQDFSVWNRQLTANEIRLLFLAST